MLENQSAKNTQKFPQELAELALQEQNAFQSLENARLAVDELARKRAQLKMSNSRVTGIAKELKELLKVFVIAVY